VLVTRAIINWERRNGFGFLGLGGLFGQQVSVPPFLSNPRCKGVLRVMLGVDRRGVPKTYWGLQQRKYGGGGFFLVTIWLGVGWRGWPEYRKKTGQERVTTVWWVCRSWGAQLRASVLHGNVGPRCWYLHAPFEFSVCFTTWPGS